MATSPTRPVGNTKDGARESGAREDGAREDGAREDGAREGGVREGTATRPAGAPARVPKSAGARRPVGETAGSGLGASARVLEAAGGLYARSGDGR
ncbi:hypothetical protein ACWD3J_32675 [Streptomyces sp. NPDC002755]